MMSPGYYHLPAVWRHGIFLHAATNTIFYRSTDSVDLQPLRQQVTASAACWRLTTYSNHVGLEERRYISQRVSAGAPDDMADISPTNSDRMANYKDARTFILPSEL